MPKIYTGNARMIMGSAYLKGRISKQKTEEEKRRYEEELKLKKEELALQDKNSNKIGTIAANVYESDATKQRKLVAQNKALKAAEGATEPDVESSKTPSDEENREAYKKSLVKKSSMQVSNTDIKRALKKISSRRKSY